MIPGSVYGNLLRQASGEVIPDGDVKLSDNYFDMNPGERRVEILKGDAAEFSLKSVYQIR